MNCPSDLNVIFAQEPFCPFSIGRLSFNICDSAECIRFHLFEVLNGIFRKIRVNLLVVIRAQQDQICEFMALYWRLASVVSRASASGCPNVANLSREVD